MGQRVRTEDDGKGRVRNNDETTERRKRLKSEEESRHVKWARG